MYKKVRKTSKASSILKAKERGYSEIWSTDGGEYESYSLDELIGETLGEESYKNAMEIVGTNSLNHYDALKEARTWYNRANPLINYNIYGNFYMVHGDNTTINNPDVKQMLSLMDRFLNNPTLTENALDELQEALGDENAELKEEMQQAKDNNEERAFYQEQLSKQERHSILQVM